MTVTFVLPSPGNIPIGGFKIIYEYANRLSERGHKICVVHSYRTRETSNPLKLFHRKIGYNKSLAEKNFNPDSWFKLNEDINTIFIPIIKDKYIPNADIIFATEYSTAKPVYKLSESKGRKVYFIQSLETWFGSERDVNETWKLPLNKIVISKWLQEYGDKIDVKTTYIPNGLDFDKFGVDIDVKEKPKLNLLMLYHENEVKGSIYGLNALLRIKKEFNNVNVSFFSASQRPLSLPEWIKYYYRPDEQFLRKLYNETAIFISPSLFEGFPLPPAEAMMCGCAVVATDIGGHREYCINNETALLVKLKSDEDIYSKIKELISNDPLRIKIAKSGNNFIRQFTWDAAINKMEKVLNNSTQKL